MTQTWHLVTHLVTPCVWGKSSHDSGTSGMTGEGLLQYLEIVWFHHLHRSWSIWSCVRQVLTARDVKRCQESRVIIGNHQNPRTNEAARNRSHHDHHVRWGSVWNGQASRQLCFCSNVGAFESDIPGKLMQSKCMNYTIVKRDTSGQLHFFFGRILQDLNSVERNKQGHHLKISPDVDRGQPHDFSGDSRNQVALCRHLVCWSFSWCSIASTHADKPASQLRLCKVFLGFLFQIPIITSHTYFKFRS